MKLGKHHNGNEDTGAPITDGDWQEGSMGNVEPYAHDAELEEEEFEDGYADGGYPIPQYADETVSMIPVAADGTELRPFARNGNAGSPQKPKMPRKRKALIIVGSIIGGLAVIYLGMAIFFMSHFGPNTVINDADCSFKNVDEVTQIVKDQVSGYEMQLDERGDSVENISGADIDLEYVEDGQVAKLLDEQNAFAWIVPLFQGRDANTMHASVSFDSDKLKTLVDSLKCMDKTKMVAPVDAYAEFDGNEWVAHPEVVGTTINTDAIYDIISDAVTNTKETLDLDQAGAYTNPAVTTKTQDLLDKIAIYNQYVPFSITYTFGDQPSETIDGQTLVSWLNIADDGTTSLNEDAVRSWLSDFASRHDTVGTTRTFTGADGVQYTVEGGTYGWSIDEDAEYDQIVSDFENKTGETRDPIYEQTADSYTSPDWGSNYIELNLTNQHMYLILNGSVAFESDVVTGLPIPARETPSGVWSILDMQSPYTMHGDTDPATGEPAYVTDCSYFMRMTWTGVAFHDASWQPWFGGDRYTYAGSHGCINMPPENAATLYSMIWIGLPVVSHY